MATSHTEDARLVAPKTVVHWYSMDVRHVRWRGLMWALLIALLVASVNISPLWRLCWRYPIYSAWNYATTADTHGRKVAAWRWVEGREIRIYQLPDIRRKCTAQIEAGVLSLLHDAGLQIKVKVLPMPASVYAAYKSSIVEQAVNGIRQPCVSFEKLSSHLVELRNGDPHADMLIVNLPIAETTWAFGMSEFSCGTCVLEDSCVNFHLGKHEACHLVGYMKHDDFPLFVLGYPWEGNPYTRDTLMMLYGTDTKLSPRAHDALQAFWQAMEQRLGEKFLMQ